MVNKRAKAGGGGERKEKKEREKGKIQEPVSTECCKEKRSIASRQFQGAIRLWFLPDQMTSELFDIRELPKGVISKLGDGRCWRGEGGGFPGEVSTHMSPLFLEEGFG